MIDKLIRMFKHKKANKTKNKYCVLPLSVQMNMKNPPHKTELSGFIDFVNKCMED